MPEMVGLVACSKSKRGEDEPDREFPAEDLYDSWLFDGRARAVKAHCEEWAIFSAKHGHVEPDDQLTWYDKRITELSPEERRDLAADVVAELPETDCLMILMGREYAEPLKAVLPDDVDVWDPLEGVQLFDQRGELRSLADQTEQETLVTDGGQPADSGRGTNRRLSVFPYPGGKTPYVTQIREKFPSHHTYVEPFGGSASVLLNKKPSYAEVFNDLNGDIVHFFRVLREQREGLIEWLEHVPFARDVYDEWADDFWSGHRPEDDIERAGRFYYLRFSNFNGRLDRRNGFKTGGERNEARSFRSAIETLDAVVARLQEVTIENLDYREILEKYDREDTLFYLDPPYVDATDPYYSSDDQAFDHGALVEALADVDGYWICSYGELPEGLRDVAETVGDFTARYSMRYADRRDEATERLAMNFDPVEEPAFSATEQTTLDVATHGGATPDGA